MGRVRRGNHIFVFWVTDHPPRHAHVYRDGKLIVKWDLVHRKAIRGAMSLQILSHISELRSERKL